ncbi:armadillo-type protein [Xylaria arbuscula]|nr:armadillo-type protein [Xylaria arbuscula]
MMNLLGWVVTCAAVLGGLVFFYPPTRRVQRRNRETRTSGIQVISDPENAKFIIVAVHGLGAHPEYTWTCGAPGTSKDRRKKIHLLRDLLTKSFPEARVLSFAYNSDWLVDAPVKTAEQIGKRMLDQLTNFQQNRGQRLRIVFIGHSFGGIVIKQALCRLTEAERLIHDTSGILFLGTPHQGSKLSFLGSVLARATGFLGSSLGLLWALQHYSQDLSDLSSRFDEVRKSLQDAKIYSIYETKPTYALGFLSVGLIVDRDSARGPSDETFEVDTDHSGLNKCSDDSSELYQAILKAIERVRHHPTLLELGDKQIRASYTAQRLKIERLSGTSLPMDQCYINLSIIQNNTRGDESGNQLWRPVIRSSLLDKLNVEDPDEDSHVQLANLFAPRANVNGEGERQPRRVLIRGVPGVGKTTLCKKIVHDFIHSTLWNSHFARLFWIPLRRLQRYERRYKLRDIFHDEYFQQDINPGQVLDELVKECRKPNAGGSLFLLDGLDEIWHDPSTDRQGIIKELLDQPNVIVTSRPSVQLSGDFKLFDLELETVGFYPDQVRQYVQQVTDTNTNTETSNQGKKPRQILDFLDQHPLVRDLVRIPIQLDALCFAWDDVSNKPPQTMTDLYQAVELSLWSKDSHRLGRGPKELLLPADRNGIVKDECMLLEKLAFIGLYNGVVVFDAKFLHTWSQYLAFQRARSIDQTLRSLSFLRSSDVSPNDASRHYYFLHLTIQEYFAARYLQRIWLHNQSFELPDTKREVIRVDDFIRRYKYLEKFDIVWRFLAGSFNLTIDSQERYFRVLRSEPLDLLGFTHQRLIMRCLFEVHPSNQKLIQSFENQMVAWSTFEYRTLYSFYDAFWPSFHQMLSFFAIEFPLTVLRKLLKEGNNEMRCAALRSIRSGRTISTDIVRLSLSWLRAAPSRELMVEVLSCCKVFLNHLSESISTERRCHPVENRSVTNDATNTPENLAKLKKDLLEAALEKITDTTQRVLMAAIKALADQLHLPIVLSKIESVLKEQDSILQARIISALADCSNLPESLLFTLIVKLESNVLDVQNATTEALISQPLRSEKVMQRLVARMNHEDPKVQQAARCVLATKRNLPEDVRWDFLTKVLDDTDGEILRAVLSVYKKGPDLPEKVLRKLVARIDGETPDDEIIVDFLRARPTLPETIMQALEKKIENEVPRVKISVMQALSEKPYLPAGVIQVLGSKLEHEDTVIRIAAIEALSDARNVPEQIIRIIVGRLEDDDFQVVRVATDALHRQIRTAYEEAKLPEIILVDIAARLEHPKNAVRDAALTLLAETWDTHTNKSQGLIQKVAERLGDDDPRIRSHAVRTLGYAAEPSTTVVQGIAARLNDVNLEVIVEAAIILSQLKSEKELYLSEEVPRTVTARLDDPSVMDKHPGEAESWIGDVLANEPSLSDTVLISLSSIIKRIRTPSHRVYMDGILSILRQSPKLATFASVSHDHIQSLVEILMYENTNRHHIAWYHYENKLHLIIDDTVIKYDAACPCSVIQELYPNQPDYGQRKHRNQAQYAGPCNGLAHGWQ